MLIYNEHMKVPPFKRIIPEQVRPYKDRFRVHHDRNQVVIKKEKKLDKKYALHDRTEKHTKEIVLEKKDLVQNNIRWRQLNIIN